MSYDDHFLRLCSIAGQRFRDKDAMTVASN